MVAAWMEKPIDITELARVMDQVLSYRRSDKVSW